jgi:histidinol dehydrogenase
MKIINNPTKNTWSEILKRPTQSFADIEETVKGIFKEIQQKGDIAVQKYTSLFDGSSSENSLVSKEEIEEATALVSDELKQAIEVAKNNIFKFHEAQKTKKIEVETTDGVFLLARKKTYSKSRFVYSWWFCAFVFNSFNVGNPSENCRLRRNCFVFTSK